MGKQRSQRRRRKKCADELANGIMLTNKKKDERERGVVGVCTIFYTGNCCYKLFSNFYNNCFFIISDGSLMISDASSDDVGVFECVATSDGNEIKSRAARIRYYRPRQKPTIIHRFALESDLFLFGLWSQ